MLEKYALDDHVLLDDDFFDHDEWHRKDAAVKHWIFTTLTVELLEHAMADSKTNRTAWLHLEEQFLENKETRTMILDAEFRTFVQGDLFISKYCRHLKGIANALRDLGEPVIDRTHVLATLRGPNGKFSYMAAIIKHTKPFPSFEDVCADLRLKEIEMQSKEVAPSTAMVTTGGPTSAAPPQVPAGG